MYRLTEMSVAALAQRSEDKRKEAKQKAIAKYHSIDKKKLLKRVAAAGATGGAIAGTYYIGKHGGFKKTGSDAAAGARELASRAKSARLRGAVKAKKAAMRFQGDKGHSWGAKGLAVVKEKGKGMSKRMARVRHPKHWRRYVKAESFDFTRDELIEALIEAYFDTLYED